MVHAYLDLFPVVIHISTDMLDIDRGMDNLKSNKYTCETKVDMIATDVLI